MKEILNGIIANIIGSGTIGVLLYFILTKWLGTKIEQTIKHDNDIQLEKFKSSLELVTNELISRREREMTTDSKLFKEFLQDFPTRGLMQMIRNASGGIFDVDITDLLDRLINTWELVDHCFLDTDVNEALNSLIAQAHDFANELGACTFPMPDRPDKYEIPPEWKTQDYEDYLRVQQMIYDHRDLFVHAYDNFVRIARGKLTSTL